jgi:hypothetical protein
MLCVRCSEAARLCAASRIDLGDRGLREARHAFGHPQADSRADRPTPSSWRVACRHRPCARALVSHGLEPLDSLSPTRRAWARERLRQVRSERAPLRAQALPGDARAAAGASPLGGSPDPSPPRRTPSRSRPGASRQSDDRQLAEGSGLGPGPHPEAQRSASGSSQEPPRGLADRRQGADAARERRGPLSALDL